MTRNALFLALPMLALLGPGLAAQTTVLTTDFSTLPVAISPGVATPTAVQGYAGLGPAGNTFGGTFLRSPTGNTVTIQLANLPPHNAIGLDLLFAAIDSLDGTGTFPSGDFFAITIDGNTFFRESFANALPTQVQSYVPPPGVELARRVDLGFSGPGSFYTDSAYWLGGDPRFQHIGHSSPTLTITLRIEGPGIQPLNDESWAIDNLTITAFTVADPGSATVYGASCGPSLSAFGLPVVAQALPLFVQDLPPGTLWAGLAIGLSDATPVPLDGVGAPGCWLWHDLAITLDWGLQLQSTAATGSLTVAAPYGYPGLTFFLQAWGLAPASNALGIVSSNGLRIVLAS
ncbi:MAG: hypothetical protein KF830_09605 [Planctomycetes bacterium]|nr:hypothetical protein [Planctomycetota bacterium]